MTGISHQLNSFLISPSVTAFKITHNWDQGFAPFARTLLCRALYAGNQNYTRTLYSRLFFTTTETQPLEKLPGFSPINEFASTSSINFSNQQNPTLSQAINLYAAFLYQIQSYPLPSQKSTPQNPTALLQEAFGSLDEKTVNDFLASDSSLTKFNLALDHLTYYLTHLPKNTTLNSETIAQKFTTFLNETNSPHPAPADKVLKTLIHAVGFELLYGLTQFAVSFIATTISIEISFSSFAATCALAASIWIVSMTSRILFPFFLSLFLQRFTFGSENGPSSLSEVFSNALDALRKEWFLSFNNPNDFNPFLSEAYIAISLSASWWFIINKLNITYHIVLYMVFDALFRPKCDLAEGKSWKETLLRFPVHLIIGALRGLTKDIQKHNHTLPGLYEEAHDIRITASAVLTGLVLRLLAFGSNL